MSRFPHISSSLFISIMSLLLTGFCMLSATHQNIKDVNFTYGLIEYKLLLSIILNSSNQECIRDKEIVFII